MNKHCSAWLASIAFGIVGRAASAQQSGCEVTMPTAFRLLARQAPASGGPEYPAQTRVRAITYGTGMHGGRRAVRVQIDTAEGWVYLWPNQLLRCPPDSIAQRPGDIDPNAQDRPNEAPPPPTTRPSTPACVPGSTQACLCVGGGSGVQSCTASGDAFESCSCVAPEPARTPPPDPGPPASGGARQIGGRLTVYAEDLEDGAATWYSVGGGCGGQGVQTSPAGAVGTRVWAQSSDWNHMRFNPGLSTTQAAFEWVARSGSNGSFAMRFRALDGLWNSVTNQMYDINVTSAGSVTLSVGGALAYTTTAVSSSFHTYRIEDDTSARTFSFLLDGVTRYRGTLPPPPSGGYYPWASLHSNGTCGSPLVYLDRVSVYGR